MPTWPSSSWYYTYDNQIYNASYTPHYSKTYNCKSHTTTPSAQAQTPPLLLLYSFITTKIIEPNTRIYNCDCWYQYNNKWKKQSGISRKPVEKESTFWKKVSTISLYPSSSPWDSRPSTSPDSPHKHFDSTFFVILAFINSINHQFSIATSSPSSTMCIFSICLFFNYSQRSYPSCSCFSKNDCLKL